MTSDRRDFLGAMLGASLLGKAGAFRLPTMPSSDWDLSWTSRLRGDHRAVFDWPRPGGSDALWRAGIWKEQVIDTFKVPPSDVSSLLVIRHAAIPMIMSDDFWARNQLGKKRKIKDEKTGKPATANPHRAEIATFLAKEGIVLACGFAFSFMVSVDAKRMGKKPEEVRPEVLTQVIPGVIIQPSGFFALLEAQRNGCGLFPSEAML